jgi:hypothetical protein
MESETPLPGAALQGLLRAMESETRAKAERVGSTPMLQGLLRAIESETFCGYRLAMSEEHNSKGCSGPWNLRRYNARRIARAAQGHGI